jgi:hypothetical protein
MTRPVKCECGSLFGIEQDDGTLAIKYRDLFRNVDGSVSGPCRKCGKTVRWEREMRWLPAQEPFTVTGASIACLCQCALCTGGSCCQANSTGLRFHYRVSGSL